MDNISKKLCLLTPSYIDTKDRLSFASESYESLKSSVNFDGLEHFIVDDSNFDTLDNLNISNQEKKLGKLYDAGLPKISYRAQQLGSASAMYEAVCNAIEAGFQFAFIHLDDQTYNDKFSSLLNNAANAMSIDKKIGWIRFSGYPLIHNGDKSFICKNDKVYIDEVEFLPKRNIDHTLWLSTLESTIKINPDDYWCVALWHSLFRLDILKAILERGLSWRGGKEIIKRKLLNRSIHLCHIELTYKSTIGLNSLIKQYPGTKYGYINMQFGGFEIHRNENWEELMSKNNEPLS